MTAANPDLTQDVLKGVLTKTLTKLTKDVQEYERKRCNWYVSEHALVNLFVFGYLVPAFQDLPQYPFYRGDLTFMGMEVSVSQIQGPIPGQPATRKDIVFWKQPRRTRWALCDLSHKPSMGDILENSHRPLAVVEWKNIHRFQTKAGAKTVKEDHDRDVRWLRANLAAKMFDIGYAILTDQRNGEFAIRCCRLSEDTEDPLFFASGEMEKMTASKSPRPRTNRP